MVLTQLRSNSTFRGYDESFHTTMVLTQPLMNMLTLTLNLVSIPLWFLRNDKEKAG